MNNRAQTVLVDIDMLTMALQAVDEIWLLDLSTGEVMPGPADDLEQEEMDTASDRYMHIEPLSEEVIFTLMESFIATVDEHCVQNLQKALSCQQPTWHFKQALAEHPESEDNWYAFREQFFALQARQWLRDRSLAFEVVDVEDRYSPDINDYIDTEAQNILLSLTLNHSTSRRYVLWNQSRPENESTLTAYDADNNVLAELALNHNQTGQIENLLSQADRKLSIQPEKGEVEVELHYTTTAGQMNVTGSICSGNWLDRLRTSLDLLLGLPGIEME